MALFECKKKSLSGFVNYMYGYGQSTDFTDTCIVGDIYVFFADDRSDIPDSYFTGFDILEKWQAGTASSQPMVVRILRANSTSVAIQRTHSNNMLVRLSKGGNTIKYSIHDLTANQNLDLNTNEGDIVVYPYAASGVTATLVSNLEVIATALYTTTARILTTRARGTSTIKDSHSFKVIRFY